MLMVVIVGAIAGWLAGTLVQLDDSSLLLDIVIGIVGGWLGYKLFGGLLSITGSPLINLIITSTAGAAVLAVGIKLIRKILR